MKIYDFGKNTQQCVLAFRFECLGRETIAKLVQHYLLKQKLFTSLQTEARNRVFLTKGDGSAAEPYHQLRLHNNEIQVWAGWNVRYEAWQHWRNQILTDLFLLIEHLPVEYLAGVTSQLVVAVPPDKLKSIADVPELEAVRTLYERFLPLQLTGKGSIYMGSSDAEGRQTVNWWTDTSDDGKTEDVSCSVRLNILDTTSNLSKNVLTHTKSADDLFEKFHSSFLSLLIRQ